MLVPALAGGEHHIEKDAERQAGWASEIVVGQDPTLQPGYCMKLRSESDENAEDSGPKSLPPRRRGAKSTFEIRGEIVLKYIEVRISNIDPKIRHLRRSQ